MKMAAIYSKAEVSQGSIHGPVVVQGGYWGWLKMSGGG